MKKKILSLLIVAVILLTLIACGSDGNGNAPVNNDASSNTGNSSTPTEDTSIAGNSSEPKLPSEAQAEVAYEITYANARSWVNIIGTVWVQAIVEVTNTGSLPLYCSTGSFDLEDSDGKLIKSVSMVSVFPEVIGPGEKAYYYEETMLDIDEAIDLVILPRVSVERARVDLIRFDVTDLELSVGSFDSGIKARGRVENTTDETYDWIYVVVVLFDGNNDPLGLLFTIIMEDLNSGDRIGFEMSEFSMPDNISVDDVHSHTVYSYPLQFQF